MPDVCIPRQIEVTPELCAKTHNPSLIRPQDCDRPTVRQPRKQNKRRYPRIVRKRLREQILDFFFPCFLFGHCFYLVTLANACPYQTPTFSGLFCMTAARRSFSFSVGAVGGTLRGMVRGHRTGTVRGTIRGTIRDTPRTVRVGEILKDRLLKGSFDNRVSIDLPIPLPVPTPHPPLFSR